MFEYALVFVYKKKPICLQKIALYIIIRKKMKIGKSHQLQQKNMQSSKSLGNSSQVSLERVIMMINAATSKL